MTAFYNENDKYPAQWLRNLSGAGLIAPGAVDERSIKDVVAEDVRGARQAHWFAGLGTWSYALRLAGIPDDFEVWSASLPCQPWSSAGQGKGFDDERHLLPDFLRLIAQCRPQCAIGEQSSSPDGLEWLDALQVGFEGLGYTVGFAVLASASVGAPHIRHRTYWVAYTEEFRWPEGWNARPRTRLDQAWLEFERHGDARELADAYRARFPYRAGPGEVLGAEAAHEAGLERAHRAPDGGATDELADTAGERCDGQHALLRGTRAVRRYATTGFEAPRSGEARELVDATGLGWRQGRLHAAEGGGAGGEWEAAEHGHAGEADTLADPDGSRLEEGRRHIRAGQPDDGRGGTTGELADSMRAGWSERGTQSGDRSPAWSGGAGGLGDSNGDRVGQHAGELPRHEGEHEERAALSDHSPIAAGPARFLGDAGREGLPEQLGERGVAPGAGERVEGQASLQAGSPTGGFWSDAVWLPCRDGKWRPVEPRAQQMAHGNSGRVGFVPPLAKGVEGRVGQIKAYGNAINSLCAATFIRAFMESTQHLCESAEQ